MNRLNKLDTEVELEILPNQQSESPNSSGVYGGNYEHYGTVKEYYCGSKREICPDNDDPFLRPPLWEDITSSIQNIDPENAIMLSALTGATQVKLETSDDTFLESLSSPLLSPLEIKTEKGYYQQNHHNNNNNNTIHLHSSHLSHINSNNNNNNNSYSVQSHYNHNNNPQAHHPNQLNGYQDFNVHHGHVPHQQYSNNYYNWQQNSHPTSHQAPVYGNKYTPQSNLCAPISRLMYVPPLTPPSSDPGSPGNSIQVSFIVTTVWQMNRGGRASLDKLLLTAMSRSLFNCRDLCEEHRPRLITYSSSITCRILQFIPQIISTTINLHLNSQRTINISLWIRLLRSWTMAIQTITTII